MLVFLREDETNKKRYSNFRVLLPSQSINPDKFKQDKIFPIEHLIPPAHLMQERLNKIIDRKTFKKKYFDYLQDESQRITISYIIYDIVKNERDYAVTCSDEEYQYGYMDLLSEFIHKFYGLNILTHDAYKILDLLDKQVIRYMNAIPEEVFDLVLDDIRNEYNKDKDKKKKKKDKKKKKKGKDKKGKNKSKKHPKEFKEPRVSNYGYGEREKFDSGEEDSDTPKPIMTRTVFRRIND